MLQEQQAQAAVSAAVEEKNRMYIVSRIWLDKCHISDTIISIHNNKNNKQKDFWKNLVLKCICTVTLLIKIGYTCTCTKIAPD